jgi:hypothetical protein
MPNVGLHICRPMNDDVDLLLCFHAKVYLQVTTCTDRSQRHPLMGTLNVTLCTMVVQGIGMGLCEFFTRTLLQYSVHQSMNKEVTEI